jgi:hypothetical protein
MMAEVDKAAVDEFAERFAEFVHAPQPIVSLDIGDVRWFEDAAIEAPLVLHMDEAERAAIKFKFANATAYQSGNAW